MKALGLTAFAAALLVALAAQGGDDAALKKEKAALQGLWKIKIFETPDGKKDDLEGATLEFDKDGKNITFTKGSETKKGTYKLNPAGTPKEIDIIRDEDNVTMEGVYQIEKATLKICLCTQGGDGRPSEVAIKEGKKYVLITLEKAK
jgi:uncharacterized protein (TIGR03067 family)